MSAQRSVGHHGRAVDRRQAEELFLRHHGRLVRQLERRLRISRELAEDACGLAWLQLIRVRPGGGEGIVGWLYTVAKHEAFTLLARRGREMPRGDLPVVSRTLDIEEVLDARSALSLISQLKPQQRLVLLLQAEGHSYRSICQLTGHTYTWVNRHISEGRRALRRLSAEL
jgi:DNA-directed RNA polymerase specialized sigma24 family protein